MKTKSIQKNIPDGWQRLRLGEIGKAIIGLTYHPSDVVASGGTLVFRSSNIQNGRIDYLDQVRVSSHISEPLKIKEGDILICARNGSRSLIGKNAFITKVDEGNTFGAFMSVFRAKKSKYLYHLFQSQLFKKEIRRDLGPTINQVTTGNLHSFKFYFPPLPEQNRIVAVLETWDKIIEKLMRKIEIKMEIKKGLMKELVTGKTRLPGFKDKWQQIKLGNIGKLISGGTPSKLQDQYWIGEVPWISSSDLIEDDIKHVNIHRYITHDAIKGSATSIIPKKSVVVVSRVGVGKVIVNEEALCTSQDFQSLVVDKDQNNPYFFAHLLIVELQKLLLSNQGTSIRGFLKKDLEALSLKVPEIKEQTSIANILTTADNEIRQIKKKLSLFNDQKKYLLNNLITGAIRTPETLST